MTLIIAFISQAGTNCIILKLHYIVCKVQNAGQNYELVNEYCEYCFTSFSMCKPSARMFRSNTSLFSDWELDFL